jgi:uncharacterized membrane protein (DUF485 family)
MLREPAVSSDVDPAVACKARLGVRMFLLYALVYGGYVTINVFNPLAMERIVLLGLNVAVVYGIGLIALAFLLSMVYTRVCARKEQEC